MAILPNKPKRSLQYLAHLEMDNTFAIWRAVFPGCSAWNYKVGFDPYESTKEIQVERMLGGSPKPQFWSYSNSQKRWRNGTITTSLVVFISLSWCFQVYLIYPMNHYYWWYNLDWYTNYWWSKINLVISQKSWWWTQYYYWWYPNNLDWYNLPWTIVNYS
jgi:hypothetical protein